MKTHKVRPVLVESKEIQKQMLWLNIETNKLWFDNHGKVSYQFKPQELILISLEDEKIEESKERYFESSNGIIKVITDMNVKTIGKYYNIIARQSKISPEYISKFIKQYNNGCVEDIEIEMDDRFGYCNKCNAHQYAFHINCSYPICSGLVIQKTEPKITNGFVTIVEKELIYFPIEVKKDSIVLYGAGKFHEERLILNRSQAALLFVELYKFLEFDKEITYTD